MIGCEKIISDKDCNTIVTNEEFLYPYIYIYILLLNKNDGTSINLTFIRENINDEIKFTMRKDGFYTLCKLKIQRNDLKYYNFLNIRLKYELMTEKLKDDFISSGIVYYENGKYYYKKSGKTLDEVQEVEICDLAVLGNSISNMEVTYYYYFQVCRLRACYNNMVKKVLEERSNLKCNDRINSENVYKRDLLWSALNTILFMAEQGQFEEASRLLESVVGCNGLCEDNNLNCGCK